MDDTFHAGIEGGMHHIARPVDINDGEHFLRDGEIAHVPQRSQVKDDVNVVGDFPEGFGTGDVTAYDFEVAGWRERKFFRIPHQTSTEMASFKELLNKMRPNEPAGAGNQVASMIIHRRYHCLSLLLSQGRAPTGFATNNSPMPRIPP